MTQREEEHKQLQTQFNQLETLVQTLYDRMDRQEAKYDKLQEVVDKQASQPASTSEAEAKR